MSGIVNGVTERDLLSTFNKLNIDTCNKSSESFSWLLEYPETSEIFNWLCTYINENNIPTSQEILDNFGSYDETDEDFQKRILEVEIVYPGIFDIDANDVNSLKGRLQNEEIDEKNCEKLTTQYLSLEHKINNEIGKLTEEELNSKLRTETTVKECLAKSKALDKLHGQLYNYAQKYKNIFSNFNNANSERYFLSQQSLHEYKHYCSSFNASIDSWMERKITCTNGGFPVEYADNEFHRVKNNLLVEISKSIQEECANRELKARFDSRSFEVDVYSEEHYRSQELQTVTRIEYLTVDNKLLLDQLHQTIELYVNQLINETLMKNAIIKRNKYQEFYKEMKQLHTVILNGLAQYKLLCLLLQIDKCKMESLRKFLKETFSYVSKYHKQYLLRYKNTNKAKAELSMKTKKENILLKNLTTLITGVYDKQLGINNAVDHLKNQRLRIETLENNLFSNDDKEFTCTTQKIKNEIQNLNKFLYCGPTLQPLIVPYEFLQMKAELETLEQKIDHKTKTTFELHKRTKTKLEKNRWLKYRCTFWAWFLTDPKNIVTTINELKDFVIKESTEKMVPFQ